MQPQVKAIAPWFGSSRIIAAHVGEALRGCNHVVVPFAGGCCELLAMEARTIIANDRHAHVMNLGSVLSDRQHARELYRTLKRLPFHESQLDESQQACRDWESASIKDLGDVHTAAHFAVASWMGRNGRAGTDGEFNGGLSVRWEAGGGDSCVRWRSFVRSIPAWHRVLERVTFLCRDAFDVLNQVKDRKWHGVYVDCPWPEDGDKYVHKFTPEDHVRLRDKLATFKETRVVVRYGDHPTIRELYPEPQWTWKEITGRTSANKSKSEVLIRNGVE